MPDATINCVDKHKEMKRIATQFYIFAFGYLLVFSPFIGVIGLQSSVNIIEGVGTLSLGIAHLASFVFVLFFTPSLVRRFGYKWTLIAGEVTYLFYVAANFHPTSYTMFPAGVLVGIGEALVWTALPMYNIYFGRLQGKFGTRPTRDYIQKYVGLFFAIFQLGQIFGSSISYIILYGGKAEYSNETDPSLGTHQTESPLNSTYRLQYCGANDCQNPDVTNVNIGRYVPPATTLYILIAVYCIMCVCGIVTYIFFLPDARPGNIAYEENKPLVPKDDAVVSETGEPPVVVASPPSVKTTLVATFRHLVRPKQVLLTPVSFYYGTFVVFVLGEVTRAYSSCVLGVEQVGLGLIVFGIASGLTSTGSRWMLRFLGRNAMIAITFLLNMSDYVLCLLWVPRDESSYVIYLMFVVFGVSNGSWQNNVIGAYADYFPDDQEIAFSLWNMWMTVGIGFGFITSTWFCVNIKIYFLMGLLAFSVACYGTAECCLYRPKAKE